MYITKCTFLNFAPEGRTETLQLTYIPQMLAAYIPCKYIYYQMLPNSWAHRNPLTDTFPPIVGMIYPIPIYKYNSHVQNIYLYWMYSANN